MTIVGLLATALVMGWSVAVSAWDRASSSLEQQRRILAVHQLLQEQMASIVPYRAHLPEGGTEFFFQGEARTTRFVTRYSLAERSRAGLYLAEYQVAEERDGAWQLLLNESPLTSAEELGALIAGAENTPSGRRLLFRPVVRGPQTTVLLEGLEQCRLEYFRPPLGPVPGAWTEQWMPRNLELPRAIAVRAVAEAEPGRLRPVEVIAAVRNFAWRTN